MSDDPSKSSSKAPDENPDDDSNDASQTETFDRSAANAKLISPIPAVQYETSPSLPNESLSEDHPKSPKSGAESPSASSPDAKSTGPKPSALANALSATLGFTRRGKDSTDDVTQTASEHDKASPDKNNYGSIEPGSQLNWSGVTTPRRYEDFDVVRRHLVGPGTASPAVDSLAQDSPHVGPADQADIDEQDFSSLRLQGGDMTREIYRRAEAEVGAGDYGLQRRNSIDIPPSEREDDEMSVKDMRQPGGFRRHHLRQNGPNHLPSPAGGGYRHASRLTPINEAQPNVLTRNFYEFLTLYGHFAGDEWDEDDRDSDEATRRGDADEDGDDERSPLLRKITRRQTRQEKVPKKGAGATVLIVLKAFIGTGVLFLPRAFFNGGMLFSFVVMLIASFLSYYCFVLLTKSRLKLKGSYAEMGEIVQGKFLRAMINGSLVLSQIGFAASYIVFTAENLQAFVLTVSKGRTYIEMKFMILMQLIVFLPLSLYRHLNSIAIAVYIADVFIVLGLIYLYYYDISTIVSHGGVHDIVAFNSETWALFVGTAVFTFEGIGLLIPIQDGMRNPEQLPAVLSGCMVIITIIFVSMGSLSYAAYGSATQTVIILNMDSRNKFVNGIQFIYSLAILLSTPLQVFPAITILEKETFTRSGKSNPKIKWAKNLLRFVIIIFTALIAWLGAGDLDKFVALVGSFACVPLVYWYPPFIHYRGVATARWQRIVDVCLMLLGLFLLVYTSALTIGSWVH